jgi:putative transposase
MFLDNSFLYDIISIRWNHDKDHIHILFKAHPNSKLSRFINAYKSASSRLIKKTFPYIRENVAAEAKNLVKDIFS